VGSLINPLGSLGDLLFQIVLAGCMAYFSSLKMEEICSFETAVNFYQTTWHHVQ
jgi:hypothetical protein